MSPTVEPVDARGPSAPPWWTLAVPFLLALGLGLWGVRRGGSMWGDESVTVDMATRSPADLAAVLHRIEIVHGLYYALMHGVFAVLGSDLVTLRLPSVLAVAVAAALVAAIGHRSAGPRAGLLAGIVLAIMPGVQTYMQEGRSYAIVTALVAAATWLLVRALDRGRAAWWWYGVAVLVACLFHEFAVLSLAAHATTLLVARVAWPTARAWLFAVVGAAVGLAPLLVVSVVQRAQVSWIKAPTWSDLGDLPYLALIGVLATCVLGAVGTQRNRPVALQALALPLLLAPPTVLLLVTFLVTPFFNYRYVLYSAVGFALLVGAALDRLLALTARFPRPAWCRATLAVAAALLVAVQVPHWADARRPDARHDDDVAVAGAVAGLARPGDAVVFLPSRRRAVTQVFPETFRGLRDIALSAPPRPSGTLYGVELSPEEVRDALLSNGHLIVVRDDPFRDEAPDWVSQEIIKRTTLNTDFKECDAAEVTGVRIVRYVTASSKNCW